MSEKHTPGPWRVGTPGPNGCYTVGTKGGLMTAMIAHSINEPDQREQAIGDARLIAAAPELLAAVNAVYINAVMLPGLRDEFSINRATLDKIKAALAKVEAA